VKNIITAGFLLWANSRKKPELIYQTEQKEKK
jgi:hypothetical protein